MEQEKAPISANSNHTEFSLEVIERAQQTDLIKSCQDGDLEVVKYFITQGVDVNTVSKYRKKALSWAALRGYTKICQVLILNGGADVNETNHYENTPLHWARRHPSVCQLLLKYGADVNKRNKKGQTPLYWAAGINGSTATCQLLIEHNAQINEADEDGYTPLHHAAKQGHTEACQLLLKYGADVNKKNKKGQTLLYSAAGSRNITTFQLFIKYNAQINEADEDGYTPLHHAARKEHTEACQRLLTRGAKVNATSYDGFTPLDIACQKNIIATTKLLVAHGGNLKKTSIHMIEEDVRKIILYHRHLTKLTLKMRCLEIILDQAENTEEVLRHLHKINVPLEVIDDCSQCKKINVVNKITPCCNKKICHQCWDSHFQEETTSNIQLVHDQTSKKVEQLIITLHATCPFCKTAHTKEKKERVAHTNKDQHTNE